MTCPLCGTEKAIVVRNYQVEKLRKSWINSFRFDPFPENFEYRKLQKLQCSKCDLIYFSPAYFGDDTFYSTLSKYVWYYEQNKWEYDVASSLIAKLPIKNMLEIGCGNGYFLDKVKSLEINSLGIDINKDAIFYASEKGHDVSLIDVFKLEDSYDLVVSFEVLEHMDRLSELFSFISDKLLRKGGYLILAVPNPNSYLKDIEMNLLDMPPHHNSSWSYETFEYIASKYHFEICNYLKEPLRYEHYFGGVISNIISEHEKLIPNTWKSRLVIKAQRLVLRLLGPLTYIRDKDNIEGQTHLVVLKNV